MKAVRGFRIGAGEYWPEVRDAKGVVTKEAGTVQVSRLTAQELINTSKAVCTDGDPFTKE
jgi:hypothetical protein